MSTFQSTLLQEERLQYRSGTVQLFYFNPRSYKRSNCNGAVCTWKDCNFNPRSYKRSDKSELELPLMCDISIHAPTRGATVGLPQNMTDLILFQSTLLQEERPRVSQQQFASWDYFNPRSYKRSDGFRVYGIPCTFKFQSTLLQEERRVSSIFTISCLYISIHAPTRGATRFRFRDNISTFYFNPRSYKRSDFLVDAAAQ